MILREFLESDLERLVELANNRKVSRYLIDTFPYPYTPADARWWISEGCKANEAISRVITLEGGELMGAVGLTPQQGWRAHIAEIGCWVAEPFWGRGIATQAVTVMTEAAFATHGFRRLIAPVLAPNAASARVLEKCGYRCEGRLQEEVKRDGVFYDILHYARTREGT
ncbi:MAG: GNAT family N-acetyltransferase [Pseudomonadota bacterium]